MDFIGRKNHHTLGLNGFIGIKMDINGNTIGQSNIATKDPPAEWRFGARNQVSKGSFSQRASPVPILWRRSMVISGTDLLEVYTIDTPYF